MLTLAECWSFHCWTKTALRLQPPTCDQRSLQDRETGPKVLMKRMMMWGPEWMEPWGAQETLTPLSCPPPWPSSFPVKLFPSQSHTWGSVACPLTPSPRLCPTWLDESGAGTEITESLEPDCSGLDSWLPPFLLTLRMSPCLSGPPGPYL